MTWRLQRGTCDMAVKWERDVWVWGSAGVESRVCREADGCWGCWNGGIWDLRGSRGSLCLGDGEKLYRGGDRGVKGQLLSAFIRERAGGDFGWSGERRIWPLWLCLASEGV